MLKRVLCGLAVAGGLLALFLLGNAWALVALAVALHLLAQDEFARLADGAGLRVERLAVPVCGVAYILATAYETPYFLNYYDPVGDGRIIARLNATPAEVMLCAVPLCFLVIGILRRRTDKALECFSVSLASFWYTAVLIGFLERITLGWPDLDTGRMALIYTLVVVKMSDAGAYFIGTRFGRLGPRLIPEVSPAKSVIGLLGGYLFGLASSLLFAYGTHRLHGGTLGTMPLPYGHAAALGLLLPTAGVFGDLAESLFKRSVKVTDSAARVPGLGGFLDMMDSPLFAAPIMVLYLRLFLL